MIELLIRNAGHILTMDDTRRELSNGDVLIRDGEIATRLVEGAGLDTVMTNSFGFGGTNGTLLFKKV